MRSTLLALAAVLACAPGRQLGPADPAQAVASEPRAATASVGGVRVTVRPAEASGWVVDERLTPVEVVVDNGSGRTVELTAERFAVVLPGGARLEALTSDEIRRRYGPSVGAASDPVVAYQRSPTGTTYFPPANLPAWWFGIAPAATLSPSTTLARARIASGSAATVLLLFDTPAARLERFDLEVDLVDADGVLVGTARVPFARGGPPAEWTPVPPIASPPPAR